MGSVQFQIAPRSSLHFSMSVGSFWCSWCYLRFNMLHRSLLKRFPLFGFGLPSPQGLISALTQAGGGGLSFRFASSVLLQGGRGAADRHCCVWGALTVLRPHWVCPRSRVCALPIYAAQAPSCSIWSVPCIAYGSSFRVLHESVDSVAPAFCVFPAGAAQAARGLRGALSPGVARPLPSAAPASVSAGASRVRAPCV